MYYPVCFKINDGIDSDKIRLLEILFKDWVDNICENQVEYKISYGHNNTCLNVQFMNIEDATAVILKGLPNEFKHYIELVE